MTKRASLKNHFLHWTNYPLYLLIRRSCNRGSVRQEMSSGRQQTIQQPGRKKALHYTQCQGLKEIAVGCSPSFQQKCQGPSKFWIEKHVETYFIPLSFSICSIKKQEKASKQTWRQKNTSTLVLLPSNMLASCTLQLSEGEQSVCASCWPHLSLQEQAPFLLESWIEDSYRCSTTRTTIHVFGHGSSTIGV